MKLLNRLPGFERSPPGLERVILRKLPWVALGGALVPALFALFTHLWPPAGTAMEVAKHVALADILAIAMAVTVWTGVLTVAIGCVVVILMKGPAYVADAYEVHHGDKPER
jgi:hypothetical protein